MSPPHMLLLHYYLVTDPPLTVEPALPVEVAADTFAVQWDHSRLTCHLAQDYASVQAARQVVDKVLRDWELHIALQQGLSGISFVYTGATVIDRDPPLLNHRFPTPEPSLPFWKSIINKIFGRFFTYWQSLTWTDRLYRLGFALIAMGLGSGIISGDQSYYVHYATPLMSVAFGLGFGIWFWPWIRKVWQFALVKFVLVWLSAGLWVLAQILTRGVVAEALELPPQDFEVTVQVWTLLFYVPLWALLVGVFIEGFALFAMGISGLLSLASSFTILRLFVLKDRWNLWLDKVIVRGFGHVIGAIIFAVLIVIGLGWYANLEGSFVPAIRLTAYYADFHNVMKYPDVDVTRKLRLHENGVVSYAEKHGWNVIISTEKIPSVSSVD